MLKAETSIYRCHALIQWLLEVVFVGFGQETVVEYYSGINRLGVWNLFLYPGEAWSRRERWMEGIAYVCMYGYLGFDGLDGWSCQRDDIGG